MGLIGRLEAWFQPLREGRDGRVRMGGSVDPEILNELDAEDAAILAAAKPVGPTADVAATLASILGREPANPGPFRREPQRPASRATDVVRDWLARRG